MIPEKSETIPAPAAAPVPTAAESRHGALPDKPASAVTRRFGIVLIFGMVLLSVWLVFNPVWIARLGSWGYLGAFLVNLLASASLFLPVPGLAISIAMSVSMNALLLALVAAAGSAVGELAGYAIGFGGRSLTNEDKVSQWAPRIEVWIRQYGAVAVFGVAALPLPFDFAGIAAGAGKMPIWRFALATFLGKFVKYYLVILVAEGSLTGVREMFGW